MRAAGERLDVQRLRELPVDPVADAAQPREVAQVLHLGWPARHPQQGTSRRCATGDDGSGAIAQAPHSGDYADSVGKALEWFEGLSGRQPNDPSRVAAAIIEAVASPEPPLRLALGPEAVEAIREKLSSQRRDLDAWERLSASTTVAL